jgi:hypothetical protein
MLTGKNIFEKELYDERNESNTGMQNRKKIGQW